MEVAVSVKNLTKKYKLYEDKWGPIKEIFLRKKLHKEFLALNKVSLDFPKGESIGVLGKNGSGKSTLLKIITGIAEPTEGEVYVNGSLVFLDVSSGIDSELSGYENIFMKGILLGYTREEMMEKVDDIIEFSELGEFINQPVKNYSSGMKSKLGFAISVNVDPDILIVDEALAVGDAIFRAKCMRKMNEFKEKGKTIIFVSHDKNAIESFCSKAAWIHEGELITYGDSKFVCSLYNDFMSGKKTINAIQSEIKFHHSIEKVLLKNKKDGLFIELEGFIYDPVMENPVNFEVLIRNERTGETIAKPCSRFPYRDNALIPEKIQEFAGFKASFNLKEFPSFFQPDRFSVWARFENELGQWTEFVLWAGNANILVDEQLENSNFIYKVIKDKNNLVLLVENRDKVQQQVNKIWFEKNLLHIEGVAFVRGYESPNADSVFMSFHLRNLDTFDRIEFPVSISETEEITENPTFNPQGKNYNYSKYRATINLDDLEAGKYECNLRYKMLNAPHYEMLYLVWASKKDSYPDGPYVYKNKQIVLRTETKHLSIEVEKIPE